MVKEVNITLQNLHFGYNQSLIDKPLNFSLSQNGLTFVLGKNGCGKSTLLQTLSGNKQPLEGVVFVNGQNLQSLKYHKKAHLIAFADTNQTIFGHFTVAEYLYFGRYPFLKGNLQPNKTDDEIIKKYIDLFHLQPVLKQSLHTLSSGQFRLVQLAVTFIQSTSIVLLDEPTANLDLDKKLLIFNLLKEVCKQEKRRIIVASHQINLAFQYASEILILNDREWCFGQKKVIAYHSIMTKLFDKDTLCWNPEEMTFKLLSD